jgi:hypothetical protein
LIPNRAFRNAGGRHFQEVTTSTGLGHLQKGHGVAFGDIDQDGDQDVYIVVGGAFAGDHYPNALFLNPGHGNRWLKLRLEGTRCNRAAIGTRITVNVQTPPGRDPSTGPHQWRQLRSSPLRQRSAWQRHHHVGRTVLVRLPRQTVTGLELDRYYQLWEGDRRRW